MWVQSIHIQDTEWHTTRILKGRLTGRWIDRFATCPYKFEYKIDHDIPFRDDQIFFQDVTMNGRNVLEWFQMETKGKAKIRMDYTAHNAMLAISRMANIPQNYHHLIIEVAFSSKALATLWKLAWGGKMVDRWTSELRWIT